MQDWDIWSEWVEYKFNLWKRSRVCLKPEGQVCIGKKEQKRWKRIWKEVGEWEYEVDGTYLCIIFI